MCLDHLYIIFELSIHLHAWFVSGCLVAGPATHFWYKSPPTARTRAPPREPNISPGSPRCPTCFSHQAPHLLSLWLMSNVATCACIAPPAPRQQPGRPQHLALTHLCSIYLPCMPACRLLPNPKQEQPAGLKPSLLTLKILGNPKNP